MSETLDLVFLCAGRGTRVGLDRPKQYVVLGGKPILIHSLAVFERLPEIGRKVIVHDPAETSYLGDMLERYNISGWVLVPGGVTRQESVRQGLALATTGRVITHNAAVPFITPAMVERALAIEADCVTTATAAQDSLVRVAGNSLQPVSREGLQVVNSPQVFKTAVFRQAHDAAFTESRKFNSDSELMLHYGHSVRLVAGPAWSFKVTDRVDLALAETILRRPDLFPDCAPASLEKASALLAPAHL